LVEELPLLGVQLRIEEFGEVAWMQFALEGLVERAVKVSQRLVD